MAWVNYNGRILPANEPVLPAHNRSFHFGDGVFESMRMIRGSIPLLDQHIDRLMLSLQLLRVEPSKTFTPLFFQKQIEALRQQMDCSNCRVRLTVWRSGSGRYTPENDDADFLIEMEPLEEEQYELNATGLVMDFCNIYQKNFTILSSLKSTSALVYVMASLYRQEKNLDDVFIMNTDGRVVEATSSNLIIYKDGKLTTPAFTEGCVAGIMKEVIISIANKMNIDFVPGELYPEDVMAADEIYLTNAVQGLRWVGKIGDRYYKNDLASELVKKLQEITCK